MKLITRIKLAWRVLVGKDTRKYSHFLNGLKNGPLLSRIVVYGRVTLGDGAVLKDVTIVRPDDTVGPGVYCKGYGVTMIGCIVTNQKDYGITGESFHG